VCGDSPVCSLLGSSVLFCSSDVGALTPNLPVFGILMAYIGSHVT
jgi:hypothetical protein